MSTTTEYGVDLLVQLGIGRQASTGYWDQSHWDSAVWGNADTSLGDWVDVTCETQTPLTLTAGASDADGVVTRWEAATCALTLLGGQWDPWAGPWAGIVGPQVALRVSWRKTGDSTWLAAFTGTVAADGWNYVPGKRPYASVSATDATQNLAAFDPVEQSPVGLGETAAERVHRILDMATWPANLRDVTPGGVRLKSSTMAEALWTQLLAVADTDLALLWFKRDGKLAFRPEGRVGVGVDLAARLVICPPAPPVPNVGPTASFTHTETDLTTSVNGAGSTDPDGTIVTYAWTFGDGATTTGVTASHTYSAAGTYTVRLTVTDDDGATNAVSHAVTVTAPLPRYGDVVAGDGAIHYWKYDEASGTTAADSIGALTATFGTAPLPTRGTAPIAPGLGLSTTAPNIEPGAQSTTANLPVALNTWTWEVWLNPTDMPGGYGSFGNVFAQFRIGFSPGWRGVMTPTPNPNYASSYILVEINSVTPITHHVEIPQPVATGASAHIVVTVGPTEFRIYVNGIHAATRTFTGVPFISNYFRNPLADRLYVGRFSDIALYPTVLTPAQIANHYAVGMAPRPATATTTEAGLLAEPAEVQVVTIGGAQFTDIRNIVSVSRQAEEGANEAATVTVRDEASGARYLRRSYSRTDLQHQDDTWSTTVANAILAFSAWPSRAPREAELSSRLGDPDTPALLLGLEPNHTFDVEDTAGVLWREGCVGWQVTVGTKSIDGTIQLSDVGRWVGGKWDSGVWDTDRWSYAVTIPGLEEA